MKVRKRSQKQEKSVAKEFNAKTQIASGSLWFADSDVRSDSFLIECKTTLKDYYSVSIKVWEKIEREATRDSLRVPLLVIDLKDSKRVVVSAIKYFNLDGYFFKYIFSQKDTPKSHRITLEDLENLRKSDEKIGYFSLVGVKGNNLFYTDIDTFKEIAKESSYV